MSQKQILVVDGDIVFQRLLCLLLTQGGYAVEGRSTAEEAMMILSRQPMDAVVLNLRLPQMSGFLLAKRLRADPQTAHLPLVALTTHTPLWDDAEVLQGGADVLLLVPTGLSRIVGEVRRLLERRFWSIVSGLHREGDP